MNKYHTVWVTAAGVCHIEKESEHPSKNHAAFAATREINEKDGILFETVDDDVVVVYKVDHFVIVTPDQIKERQEPDE